ncbi:serine/threonine protein kinases [Candidatus Moduliflexus flocculans]|uniref:Serine/threonine protein kinases n=1 Tax=Candidatus Moduliflexus flocculans TaxID=1499966 RepID=A0A0S6VRX6_9BACT|nr:serine/threonine protein kinases [Candidatus Moduliflexus flocculans]
MLTLQETQLDAITEIFYRLLRGEKPAQLSLPPDAPENEYTQVVAYINRFLSEYNEFADFMYSLSRGELDYDPPKGKMRVLQSFKSLQASLRHLTWKTQKIAAGDFTQRVDFMGDFSAAFNAMTQQLQQAFADLERANAELAEKNRQITSSIQYARRIQEALLPSPERMAQASLGEYFILYLPLSIVSGDFYWLAQVNDDTLTAVVDCTGHGVSGALLSMIGQMLLNKIVVEERILDPAQILERLHGDVRAALQQRTGEAMDGMDVSLCRLHSERDRVTFAGAKRPLYHVTPQGLQEIKGDRKPIGGRQKEDYRAFTNRDIAVKPGDMLYLCSDGLADQPDPDEQKFGSPQLRAVLAELAPLPLDTQKARVIERLQAHQRHEPQRDDITMLGIRV